MSSKSDNNNMTKRSRNIITLDKKIVLLDYLAADETAPTRGAIPQVAV